MDDCPRAGQGPADLRETEKGVTTSTGAVMRRSAEAQQNALYADDRCVYDQTSTAACVRRSMARTALGMHVQREREVTHAP
jgi:hypothetical protein